MSKLLTRRPNGYRRLGIGMAVAFLMVVATGSGRAGILADGALGDDHGLLGFIQIAPSADESASYEGLLAASARGDVAAIRALAAAGADLNQRDSHGRTPLMVAAYGRHYDAIAVLIALGADSDALDNQRYDVITIAGVIDDVETVRLMISAGANPGLITSPYQGTALIASAHLGRVAVVRELIAAGAPLDHVNNLGWTALIEAIVLGDGGPAHTAIVRDLVAAGADVNLADRSGVSPLALALGRGYMAMVEALRAAGAQP
ncbi:MAG: ankyrin repeat domain-containing protein [Alphaproteobacteria bacterium]